MSKWLPYGHLYEQRVRRNDYYVGGPNPFALTGELGSYIVNLWNGAWTYLCHRPNENYKPDTKGYEYVSLGAHIFGLSLIDVENQLLKSLGK
jgi:hypothetical protein